jgi:hypothetical protein
MAAEKESSIKIDMIVATTPNQFLEHYSLPADNITRLVTL